MREGKTYRDHLEYLNQKFNGKIILKWCEVMEATGRGRSWCEKHLNLPHDGCTVVQLARELERLSV